LHRPFHPSLHSRPLSFLQNHAVSRLRVSQIPSRYNIIHHNTSPRHTHLNRPIEIIPVISLVRIDESKSDLFLLSSLDILENFGQNIQPLTLDYLNLGTEARSLDVSSGDFRVMSIIFNNRDLHAWILGREPYGRVATQSTDLQGMLDIEHSAL